MSVVLLDLGFVLHPDLHPKALLFALPISRISVIPLVDFSMLHLPSLGEGKVSDGESRWLCKLTSHSSTIASKGEIASTVWRPRKATSRANFIMKDVSLF